jgi:hypothetical protein
MVTQWYCRILGGEIQGEERGPVTDEELRSMAASGALAVDDFVRAGLDGDWVRAATVSGLFDSLSRGGSSRQAISGEFMVTTDGDSIDGAWCSLELPSTDTKASIRWTTPGTPTVINSSRSKTGAPVVRVPHRTLKVGHGATTAGRAEKRAHQTTVASGFNAEADTIVSANLDADVQKTLDSSAEHRV